MEDPAVDLEGEIGREEVAKGDLEVRPKFCVVVGEARVDEEEEKLIEAMLLARFVRVGDGDRLRFEVVERAGERAREDLKGGRIRVE